MRRPEPGRATTERSALNRRSRRADVAFLTGLAASAFALALAPALMPESYSWVRHTTSESAAQGIPGAWLARLGFLLFGFSVLGLSQRRARSWGQPGAALHATFGVMMIATAAFSHRSWDPQAPFDRVEDLLHSVTATVMGFAIALGVIVVVVRRLSNGRRPGALGIALVLASVIIPLSMSLWPEFSGALQRLMFLIAYGWYAVETLRQGSTTHVATQNN